MARIGGTILVAVLLIGAAACSDDKGAAESARPDDTVGGDTASTTVTEVPTTTAPPTTTAAPEITWETVVAPADCMCADGSEFSFFIKHADPTKVVLFFDGGGACFNADTCAAYKGEVGLSPERWARNGIFDDGDPRNPFAGWSMVYVPYCTGDVFLGNTTHDYGNGVVMNHKGFVNGSSALNALAAAFPDAEQLMVTGVSAGSVPTPLYAGMASDLLPDTRITVLADGSGAYPDAASLNGLTSTVWGTMNAVPDWPELAGITPDDWSFPELFIHAGRHDPDIVFARHDYTDDVTQAFFTGFAGVDDLLVLIDQNEVQIEAAGVPLHSFIAPGPNHTILYFAEFYTEGVDGMLLTDWVQMLVDGEPMSDNHCCAT